MLPDFESRKEMRKIIFGDPEKGKTNYSFGKILEYFITVAIISIVGSILYSYFS
jgi:preprotein translocase subunit SecE